MKDKEIKWCKINNGFTHQARSKKIYVVRKYYFFNN